VSIESDDVLDSTTSAGKLKYALKLFGSGSDGIDFGVAANACYRPAAPAGFPTYLGAGKVLMSTPSLDFTAIQACPPAPVDSDGDGLSDAQEAQLGTDPSIADTDGGGISDGAEVSAGKPL